MQRHPSLIPLSHEHKRLLFACRYLKKDAAPYKGFPLDTNARFKYIVSVFQEVMVGHIQKEEYLFELCKGHHPAIDALIQELLLEHQQISRMYSALSEPGTLLDDTMDSLARSLETHIRKEERILFQLLQEHLPQLLAQLNFNNS